LFWRRKKREDQKKLEATEIYETIDEVAKKLELKEGEKVLEALPRYIGVRDFDPTHAFSCDSVRDKVTTWRLGAFIITNMHLIFKQLEEDGNFNTILNIPLKKVYTAEVGEIFGVKEKHLEICSDLGSFEFKGVDNEGIYKIAEALQNLCDNARQAELEAEFPTTIMIPCEYCKARNKPDATFCVNCGALLK